MVAKNSKSVAFKTSTSAPCQGDPVGADLLSAKALTESRFAPGIE
jgi:hypothetical protein